MTRLPVVALLMGLACHGAPAQPVSNAALAGSPGGQAAAAPTAKPVPAELPSIIARVNGEEIDRPEFERAVKSVEARAGGPVPPDRRDEVYRNILDQLVAYRLLAQESKIRNQPVSDAEIDARLGEIRRQFPSDDAYKQALTERQITAAQLREDTTIDVRISKMLEAEIADAPIPEKDISDFYAQNQDQFKEEEGVRARHILIRLPEQADAAAKTKARAEAEQVLKEARAGADFAALAKEHSQDPGSAVNGGDLGFFARGQMVPEFETAAFALPPGGMSNIVETQFGYHLIQSVERRAGRTIPLVEVSERIQQFLRSRAREMRTEDFVGRLKAKGEIELFI